MNGLAAFISGGSQPAFPVKRPVQRRQWAVHLLSANGELLHELRFASYGAAEALCDALPEHQDFILVGAVS